MEKQTVYAKLKQAESFLQQIPEDIRTLFKFKVGHTEFDDVLVSFRLPDSFIGFVAEKIPNIKVDTNALGNLVTIKNQGVSITLYSTGHSHHTLF